MTSKTNILVDKILKGVPINKNNEINYTANIIVELDKDVPFEYAIIDEGTEDNSFIPFSQEKKFVIITHKNIDNIFKKKMLLLKSSEKSEAEITVELERIFNTDNILETMGPRGTVLLNSTADNGTTSGAPEEKTPWYKDPWILGAIFVVILLVAMFVMKNSKKNNNNNNGSIFLD